MADNTTLPSGSGGDTLRSEDRGSYKTPVSLIDVGGTAGEALIGDGTNAMPIKDGGNSITVDDGATSLTVDGTVAATQSGTWTVTGAGGSFPVTDSSGSLTVDAPVATPVFVRLSDGSSAISALPITDNAGSLTVDGTVAATQSGTWNVTNISGTVSLPTGAATEATLSTTATHTFNINEFLNAQNPGADAIALDSTVNGVAIALSDLIKTEDTAHASGAAGVQSLAVRNDSDASLCGTTGDYTPLQVDANGYLKVNIKAGAGSGGTALTDDAAFTAATTSFTPIGGIVTADSVDSGDGGAFAMLANRQQKVTLYDSAGAELSVGGGTQYDEDAVHSSGSKVTGAGVVRKDTATSLAGTDGDYSLLIVDADGRLHVNPSLPSGAATEQTLSDILANGIPITGTVTVGSHAVTNAGTFAVQVDGSALTALQLIDDGIATVASAITTKGMAAVGTDGTNARILKTDSSGELQVDVLTLPALTAGTAALGSVNVAPTTAGGWDSANMTSGDTFTALTSTAQAIKASAGKLGGWYIYNPNSSAAYVNLYNVAHGSVTVGTTTPKLNLCIPATSGANLEMVNGITFDTAISVSATTTGGGNTAPSTALEANFWYK